MPTHRPVCQGAPTDLKACAGAPAAAKPVAQQAAQPAQQVNPPTGQGSGYELPDNGKVVSSPDAASCEFDTAHDNRAWNRRNKPTILVECRYNGRPF